MLYFVQLIKQYMPSARLAHMGKPNHIHEQEETTAIFSIPKGQNKHFAQIFTRWKKLVKEYKIDGVGFVSKTTR